MNNCITKKFTEEFPDRIAIAHGSGEITYRQFYDTIAKMEPQKQIFYTGEPLPTIYKIFSLLLHDKRAVPVNPKEPKLPDIEITDGAGFVLMTSGSTGKPKGVVLDIESYINSAKTLTGFLEIQPELKWLYTMPLYHTSGIGVLIRTLHLGGTLVFPSSGQKPTHVTFIPLQMSRYLETLDKDNCPDQILIGGQIVPESLVLKAHNMGIKVTFGYGMTEMAGPVTTGQYIPGDGVHAGKPLPGCEVKIADDGEILIRSTTMAKGYLDRPLPVQDGWYKSKDIGKFVNGNLVVMGRKDRMIKSGGEMIHLEEIELTAIELPGIEKVEASSRPDAKWGERPTLKVWTRQAITIDQIRDQLKEILPNFKIPSEEDIEII